MYLSRIRLDDKKRRTMKALASPNLIHGAVEASFSGPRQRNLWRIDSIEGKKYVLIVSKEKPELAKFSAQFGTDQDFDTKAYDSFLEGICDGSKWRFRITANPTISKSGKGQRGKVMAHITEKYQKEWLVKKSIKNGFELAFEDFMVTGSDWKIFQKRDASKVTILGVTFEGVLTVRDSNLFVKMLCEGLGKEKAYGMGLMTVMKA